jgi:hypothetical protein
MKTNAGSDSSPRLRTAERSGSAKTKNSRLNGPRNWRASSAELVTMKLDRAAEPLKARKIRVAVGKIQELSLVYGSTTIETK